MRVASATWNEKPTFKPQSPNKATSALPGLARATRLGEGLFALARLATPSFMGFRSPTIWIGCAVISASATLTEAPRQDIGGCHTRQRTERQDSRVCHAMDRLPSNLDTLAKNAHDIYLGICKLHPRNAFASRCQHVADSDFLAHALAKGWQTPIIWRRRLNQRGRSRLPGTKASAE